MFYGDAIELLTGIEPDFNGIIKIEHISGKMIKSGINAEVFDIKYRTIF